MNTIVGRALNLITVVLAVLVLATFAILRFRSGATGLDWMLLMVVLGLAVALITVKTRHDELELDRLALACHIQLVAWGATWNEDTALWNASRYLALVLTGVGIGLSRKDETAARKEWHRQHSIHARLPHPNCNGIVGYFGIWPPKKQTLRVGVQGGGMGSDRTTMTLEFERPDGK
jgi:hypothetical protein